MSGEGTSSKKIPLPKATVTKVDSQEVARILQSTEKPHCSRSDGETGNSVEADDRVPMIDDTSSTEENHVGQANDPEDKTCNICNNSRFQEATAADHDKRILKPCFCDFRCHHGCLVEILSERKKCLLCDVEYRVFKYGSLCDFFSRYWYQYACCIITIVFVFFVGIYGVYNAANSPGNFGLARFGLVVCGIALIVVGGSCVLLCCRSTIFYRWRRFRERYSQITIFDYKPDKGAKGTIKPDRAEFKTLGQNEARIVLPGPNVTVGQYLLGHKKTGSWQDASTPLATGDDRVRFTFDTPMNDISATAAEEIS